MREEQLGKLLDVIIDHRGKTPKKLGGVDFTDAGVPVVSAIHIKNGRINWDERRRYAPQWLFEKWMPVRLRVGDVLLTSEAPLGEVAQVEDDDDLIISQRLFALRGKEGCLDSTYLRYFLQSTWGQQRLLDRATGTTVFGIRQAELVRVKVPVPPIEEQRRVARVLGSLDDLIDTNRKLTANLWSAMEAAFMVASAQADVVPAGACIELRYGKALPAPSRRPGPVAVVSSAGVVGSHDQALIEGPGVVIGRKGSVGTVTWVDRDFFPIDTAFYVESSIPASYCYFALRSMGLEHMNTDSAVPGLNRANALSRPFPRPAQDALDRFVDLTEPCLTATKELKQEADELVRTRDELLPLLVSGRVRVEGVAA